MDVPMQDTTATAAAAASLLSPVRSSNLFSPLSTPKRPAYLSKKGPVSSNAASPIPLDPSSSLCHQHPHHQHHPYVHLSQHHPCHQPHHYQQYQELKRPSFSSSYAYTLQSPISLDRHAAASYSSSSSCKFKYTFGENNPFLPSSSFFIKLPTLLDQLQPSKRADQEKHHPSLQFAYRARKSSLPDTFFSTTQQPSSSAASSDPAFKCHTGQADANPFLSPASDCNSSASFLKKDKQRRLLSKDALLANKENFPLTSGTLQHPYHKGLAAHSHEPASKRRKLFPTGTPSSPSSLLSTIQDDKYLSPDRPLEKRPGKSFQELPLFHSSPRQRSTSPLPNVYDFLSSPCQSSSSFTPSSGRKLYLPPSKAVSDDWHEEYCSMSDDLILQTIDPTLLQDAAPVYSVLEPDGIGSTATFVGGPGPSFTSLTIPTCTSASTFGPLYVQTHRISASMHPSESCNIDTHYQSFLSSATSSLSTAASSVSCPLPQPLEFIQTSQPGYSRDCHSIESSPKRLLSSSPHSSRTAMLSSCLPLSSDSAASASEPLYYYRNSPSPLALGSSGENDQIEALAHIIWSDLQQHADGQLPTTIEEPIDMSKSQSPNSFLKEWLHMDALSNDLHSLKSFT